MIPPLDAFGLLPAGVHPCTRAQLRQRFCWNPHRDMLFAGFLEFMEVEWSPMGLDCPVYVDGSFTRQKDDPSDIDLVIDLGALDLHNALQLVLHLRQQHGHFKASYHCDVWPRHPMLPNDVLAFFQYTGEKAAAQLQLPIKHPKGVLRVTP